MGLNVPNKSRKFKIAGLTMIDAARRHNADQGGRNPLTSFPLVPVGCVMPGNLLFTLKQRSEDFINPVTYRPYGVTALCRVLCEIMVDQIDRIYEDDVLKYLDSREEGVSGRATVGIDSKKVALLIVKSTVEKINERVQFYNNPLIGTSSVVRYLIEKGLRKCKIEDFYAFAPPKHLALMVTKRMTIDDLQKRYRLEVPKT